MDRDFEGSKMAYNLAHPHGRRLLTIDDLPDDVLLEIFDFYVVRFQSLDFRQLYNFNTKRKVESWQPLVHVCRRWRGLVFGSPRHLNLQICCFYMPTRSSRKSLDVWPAALPLLILGGLRGLSERSVDKIISRLGGHSDRICQIHLDCDTRSLFEKLWTAMQVPFPELAVLYLSFAGLRYAPVLPDSFLAGTAPRLRHFYLHSVPFPGLPNLLFSATHLVKLYLHDIPHSGYISPEAMATCLSMLTSLETLQLEFVSPLSCPDLKCRPPFPPTRSVLPTLTTFGFKGLNEYLEEFVVRIDAPRLYQLLIAFFNDDEFKSPELNQFISRTPTLGAHDEARFIFSSSREALVRLRQYHLEPTDRMVEVEILSVRQLSTLAQICTLSLRPLLTMENLCIDGFLSSPLIWDDDIENAEWLDLLLPFTAVKNLYLSEKFSPRIALALQELTGERTTEVLPALENVLLEGFQPSEPVQEGIAQFISARQLTDHPVTISVWE